MEALLLAIYAFFVWLIFIKLKWLPWTITSQVIVVIIPIVGLTAMILTLNVAAPSSSDVRVFKYVVQILPQVRGRVVEVPVCYGGEFGCDLDAVASHAGIDAACAIARHCAGEYRVAMLGFAPGFPYLLGLDPTLHMPRRAQPRLRVPPGSVAIGGAQTGIYPRELPGGWHLIGRTPVSLFDVEARPPSLLAPGDRVRFRAIDAEEFEAIAEANAR